MGGPRNPVAPPLPVPHPLCGPTHFGVQPRIDMSHGPVGAHGTPSHSPGLLASLDTRRASVGPCRPGSSFDWSQGSRRSVVSVSPLLLFPPPKGERP